MFISQSCCSASISEIKRLGRHKQMAHKVQSEKSVCKLIRFAVQDNSGMDVDGQWSLFFKNGSRNIQMSQS